MPLRLQCIAVHSSSCKLTFETLNTCSTLAQHAATLADGVVLGHSPMSSWRACAKLFSKEQTLQQCSAACCCLMLLLLLLLLLLRWNGRRNPYHSWKCSCSASGHRPRALACTSTQRAPASQRNLRFTGHCLWAAWCQHTLT